MKTVLWAPDNDHSLNPLTRLLPKPLVPVLNRPMLEFYFLQAREAHSSEIILLIDGGAKQVAFYLKKIRKNNAHPPISIVKNSNLSPLKALFRLQNRLNETFVFVDTRMFSIFNWGDLLQNHRQSGAILSVVYLPFSPVKDLSALTVDKQNRLTAIRPISQSDTDKQLSVLANCFFFEPEILKYLQTERIESVDRDLIPFMLSKGVSVNAIQAEGLFEPLSSLFYYWRLNLDLLNKSEPKYLPELHALAKGIWAGSRSSFRSRMEEDIIAPVLIGKHSKIGRAVTIRGPAIIGNHVKLAKGAIVNRSIILDHTYIGKTVEVKDSIIAQNCYISVHKVFGTFIEEDFILSEYRSGNWVVQAQHYFWAIFDRLLAISLIIFLLPLFLLIAFLIKLETAGPVWIPELCKRNQKGKTGGSDHYHHVREGDIKYYRFRTVYIKENQYVNEKERGGFLESRVGQKTYTGKFLEKTNLENLPILISIAFWGTKILQFCEKRTEKAKMVNQHESGPIPLMEASDFDSGSIQDFLSFKGHLRLWRKIF